MQNKVIVFTKLFVRRSSSLRDIDIRATQQIKEFASSYESIDEWSGKPASQKFYSFVPAGRRVARIWKRGGGGGAFLKE